MNNANERAAEKRPVAGGPAAPRDHNHNLTNAAAEVRVIFRSRDTQLAASLHEHAAAASLGIQCWCHVIYIQSSRVPVHRAPIITENRTKFGFGEISDWIFGFSTDDSLAAVQYECLNRTQLPLLLFSQLSAALWVTKQTMRSKHGYLRQGGYVLAGFCLFVCLSAC